MAEYLAASDLQNRMTPEGYRFYADVDQSGTGVDASEEAAYVDPAIKWAGAIVDQAIQARYDTAAIRQDASTNQWVKDRATDLAAFRFALLSDREPSTNLQAAYQDALERLDKVEKDEADIPGAEQVRAGNTKGQVEAIPFQGFNVSR